MIGCLICLIMILCMVIGLTKVMKCHKKVTTC